MENSKVVDVNLDNVHKETFYCIKDIKKPGFESKRKWFEKRLKEGLRLKILKTESDKMIGFIEFIPASKAWRPVAGSQAGVGLGGRPVLRLLLGPRRRGRWPAVPRGSRR